MPTEESEVGFCGHCGTENPLTNKFCGHCGKQLDCPQAPAPDAKPEGFLGLESSFRNVVENIRADSRSTIFDRQDTSDVALEKWTLDSLI